MSIAQNIKDTLETINNGVSLVAVSKTKPSSAIEEAYAAGHRDFGENKVQELAAKYEELPKDINWHLIGHLQTNKVKYIAPFVHLIHAVDSEKLVKEIQKRAAQNNRSIHILLQVRIAQEETKFGMPYQEAGEMISNLNCDMYPNIKLDGLMGMATNISDQNQVKKEFTELHSFFKEQQNKFPALKTLSMGMSGDYKLAMECGSNMVRIGSAIFGARSYN